MINHKTLQLVLYLCLLSVLCACSKHTPIKPEEPIYTAEQLQLMGQQAYLSGDYQNAIALFQTSLDYYRRIDRLDNIMQLLINLSRASLVIHRTETASRYLDELAMHLKYSPSKTYLEHSKLLQSEFFIHIHNFTQAEKILSELLTEIPIQTTNDPVRTAALFNRAIIAVERGDTDQSAWINRIEQLGTQSHLEQARLQRLHGRYQANQQHASQAAEAHYESALEYYRRAMFPPGIAASLNDLGDIYFKNNNLEKSLYYFTQALQIRLLLGDANQSKILLKNLQKIEAKQAMINDNLSLNPETIEHFEYLLEHLESE